MNTNILRNLTAAIFISYATVAISSPHWGYDEQAQWGAIKDDTQSEVPLMYPYATCGIGKHQSPIDLTALSHEERLDRLKFRYPTDKPVFYNTGHAAQVNTSDDYQGHAVIGEESYPLIQFHFHEPSEHVIGEKKFPAELHYVHIKDDGKIAVVSVLIEEGESNPVFQTILDNVPTSSGEQNDQSGIRLNPGSLLPKNQMDHYSLAGSLTTPPCSEGVNWLVLSEPITISQEQLAQLKSIYSDNARNKQELNGRSVSQRINH